MGTSPSAFPNCPLYLPMKRFFSVFFLIFITSVTAQTKIEGVVTDDTGMPIAFANIIFANGIRPNVRSHQSVVYWL